MSEPDPAELCLLSGKLRDAFLTRDLSDDDRESLLSLMVAERFVADDVIIRQETITRNLWLLVEGDCEVVKEPPIGSYGESVSLAKLQPYDVFGEMALVSSTTHVASVEARTAVRTLRLRGADFDRLVEDQPRLACRLSCNLLHVLSQRLRTVDERLTNTLDNHAGREMQRSWEEVRGRLGRLYAG